MHAACHAQVCKVSCWWLGSECSALSRFGLSMRGAWFYQKQCLAPDGAGALHFPF